MFGNQEDISDEDYFNSLADEDELLLSGDVIGHSIESTDDEVIDFSDTNKLKYRHKVNKPLLLIGVAMIIVVVLVNKSQSSDVIEHDNLYVNSLEDYTEQEYNIDKDVSSTYEIISDEDENYIEPVDGEHLAGLPVVVTTEVDDFFRKSVDILKVALSIDTFVAENNVYSEKDMASTLAKLIEDFDAECSNYVEHAVPEGCEDFDKLVMESINSYTYYFHEVLQATELGTRDEYNSKVSAAISYVKTKMSGLSDSSSKWEYVFIYYGLFNG